MASFLHGASPSVRFALRFGASWALARVTMPVGASSAGMSQRPGIHIPEQYGGAGFGMVGASHRVTEELSGALLCARYFSKGVLAANGILHAGAKAQKSALLQDFAKCRPLA